jgi:hypothetical protein
VVSKSQEISLRVAREVLRAPCYILKDGRFFGLVKRNMVGLQVRVFKVQKAEKYKKFGKP